MLVLSLLLLCASAFAFVPRTDKLYYALEDAEKHFEDFMNTHDVNYSSELEKQTRFEIFKKNLEEINRMNSDPDQTAHFGVTKFSDLTKEEFRMKYTGLRMDDGLRPSFDDESPPIGDLPENFDWRDKGVVTPVKNQGQAGTCWSFSTTGTVEGAYAKKHGQRQSFSEQQLVDCDHSNNGVNGGWPYKALTYLEGRGSEGEADYPYTASQGNCQYDSNKVRAQITGYSNISFQQDDVVRQALVDNAPISFTIDATLIQSYRGGIYNCPDDSSVDHAVLLVGYGTEGGVPYWLVKNSWGTSFGEGGYFRIKRDPSINPCGIRSYYGVVAETA